MHTWLYRLGSDEPVATEQIGQKAFNLNQLLLAGFSIPAGICVTTEAFHAAIKPFAERIRQIEASFDFRDAASSLAAAQAITALDGLTLPPGLSDELSSARHALCDGPVVVRSSATSEDLRSASFAGQFHTKLGVTTLDAITAAILTCWRSFFSANALTARTRVGQGQKDDSGMAALIQPMVDAECAGVCFTVDPVRNRPGVMMVTAAWGLGIGVADGTAPSDTLRIRRSDLSVEEAIIANKDMCYRFNASGGVQHAAVSDAQRQIACLPDDWLRRIGQFGLAAEQHFGQPQDIEWAIADQKVWVLQSRPITTLSEDVRNAVRFPIEWANEQERTRSWWLISQADLPLLPSALAFRQVSLTGSQMSVVLGGSSTTRWVKYVNGRIYMAKADSPLGPGDQRIRYAALMDLLDRLEQQDVTLWEHWGPEVVRATDRLSAFDARSADGNALADHLEDTLAAAERHWMIHTLMPRHGNLDPLLSVYRQITGKQPAEAEQDVPFLLQGAETVQTRLIEKLYDLALLATVHPTVSACTQSDAPDRLRQLSSMPEANAFLEQFEALMHVYGGRVFPCPWSNDGTSDITLPLPWREAPDRVLDLIADYVALTNDSNHQAPRDARDQALRMHLAWVEDVCAETSDLALVETFRRHLTYARRNAAGLDDHNHHIDQLSEGQYAQALIDAGRWLATRGDLSHPYDAFWLYPQEITVALRSSARHDFAATLAAHRAQFAEWHSLHAPANIGLPHAHLPKRPDPSPNTGATALPQPSSSENRLVGQAASAGKRSGRARIIPHTAVLPDVAPGDVLIASNAGPAWTPVFAVLAGIVLDGSYPGDHSGITAREFGVPAVFCTGNATQRIPEGAWVTVDGNTDTVTWD